MKLTALNAISPIDGRYRSKTKSLAAYFSEEALIKYRVRVEIEYFIALCELPLPQLENFNPSLFEVGDYLMNKHGDEIEIKSLQQEIDPDGYEVVLIDVEPDDYYIGQTLTIR